MNNEKEIEKIKEGIGKCMPKDIDKFLSFFILAVKNKMPALDDTLIAQLQTALAGVKELAPKGSLTKKVSTTAQHQQLLAKTSQTAEGSQQQQKPQQSQKNNNSSSKLT